MAYGLIYQGEFSSNAEHDYRLEILRKDYTGTFSTLPMAAIPIVQTWGPDDPKAPVKGCTLTIRYLNKGSNPIENFYANNDDEFQVVFYQDSQVLFKGFLVSDDIREPLLDSTHEVQLSASDNLGLLKDIAFDKNSLSGQPITTAQGDFISITVPVQNWIYLRHSDYQPLVGVPFTITGHPILAMNGTFTPIFVNIVATGSYDVKTNTFTGDTAAEPVLVNGLGGTFSINQKNTLLNIIGICLQNTGLELETYVYANLLENNQVNTKSFLQQTLIENSTFYTTDKFMDCYSILDTILKRLNLTLFQAMGRWNIVHWDELRAGTSINAYVYDKSFLLTGTATLDAGLLFGFQQDTYPETGIAKSFIRPYEFIKETFNYSTPKYLLRNYDLLNTGALLRTYVNGPNTIKEYVALDWEGSDSFPIPTRFIRVTIDTALQNEILRELVVKGATPLTTVSKSVRPLPIEGNKGDKIKFSFAVRGQDSFTGVWNLVYALMITNGGNTAYLDEVPVDYGNWVSTIGFIFNGSGTNTNAWHTIEMTASPLPFDCLIYCYLTQLYGDGRETMYKDIRFEYTPFINETTKIIGHVHKDLQVLEVKNNTDETITIDDTPRNSINGTLFWDAIINKLWVKTSLWHRAGITESKKLGEIITREQLQYKSMVRTKLEGSLRGLVQSGKHVSMLNYMNYTEMPGLTFLFGALEIDYRNDRMTGNLWEIFQDGEADVADTYTFTYLYDSK